MALPWVGIGNKDTATATFQAAWPDAIPEAKHKGRRYRAMKRSDGKFIADADLGTSFREIGEFDTMEATKN